MQVLCRTISYFTTTGEISNLIFLLLKIYIHFTLNDINFKCLLYFQMEEEKEKVKQIEESNHCMVLQLQECKERNCSLIKEKSMIEQNNCEIISEVKKKISKDK